MNTSKDDCKQGATERGKSFWDYHGLARDGINVLLNNGFEESQKLFRSHRFDFILQSY